MVSPLEDYGDVRILCVQGHKGTAPGLTLSPAFDMLADEEPKGLHLELLNLEFHTMANLIQTVSGLWKDESGATAIEYGLIAAGIAVAIVVALTTVGGNLKKTFNNVAGNL